ncbi:hypothetical protein [Alkalihalobacterium chitinilyticum]|uniref:DUF1795 domain-containing protein n=1 Tax=Alkalihalobacterium chitinilyticum TaxID=2980103 RepID=A0ABT5VJT9_9BACI|nr:hypothetical protein [Alkalihalobacterium chitinilyticum]MDE5415720.1 hypothetical protein [Alkalihalobacterium chitinilyticum]
MLKIKKIMVCLLAGAMLAAGCSSVSSTPADEAQVESKTIFYENMDAGLKIYESNQWTLEQEVFTRNLNATFQYETVKAIVSVLPSEKSMDQIKQELQLGDGLITILEESDHFFSFHTNQKEGIRSDLFLDHDQGKTLIVTFMSPMDDFERYQEDMNQFKKNIKLTEQEL